MGLTYLRMGFATMEHGGNKMDDLISRAALLDEMMAGCMPMDAEISGITGDTCTIRSYIENAPAVDAVPVIRCYQCKHWGAVDCGSFFTCKYDILNGFVNKGYGYCSYGERRE